MIQRNRGAVLTAFVVMFIVVGGIVAYCAILKLKPRSSNIESLVRVKLDLTSVTALSIARRSGQFYRLDVNPAEGGGYWVIVRGDTGSMEIVTTGQDYSKCAPLEAANVPIALAQYCWSPKLDGRLMDRRTGTEADPNGQGR